MQTHEKKRISIIEKTLPAIVSISVFYDKYKYSLSTQNKKGSLNFISRKKQNSEIPIGSYDMLDGGSGFFVDKSGIIVTSLHVVHKSHLYYEIKTQDGKKYKAKLVGINPLTDIAFLKINSRNIHQSIAIGNSSKIKLGQDIITIGNALGIFSNTVSSGIVSGLSRSIDAKSMGIEESLCNLIQIDAAINPGNSGGPLIDSNGKAIGITSAIASDAENISFAIPIDVIKNDLAKIKKFGKLNRPFLGVHYSILDKKLKEKIGVSLNGVIVLSPSIQKDAVLKGWPAYKAGIKTGDIITHINNKEIDEKNTLRSILDNIGAGREIKLTIIRGKRTIKKKVFLAGE